MVKISTKHGIGDRYISVSEIEFCTLYVVAERWILGCILRFMHKKSFLRHTVRLSPKLIPRGRKWLLFSNRSSWKRRPPLCHPDRSGSAVEGSAVQPTFTGNVFRQSLAQWRDSRFLCSTSEVAFLLIAKALYDPKREPQVPLLRCASIGMTSRTLVREL